jgi:hypothetical protein
MLLRAMRGIDLAHATMEGGWATSHVLGVRGQCGSDGKRLGCKGFGMPRMQLCWLGRSGGNQSPALAAASTPDSEGIARGADNHLTRLLLVANAGTAGSGHASHGPSVWAASFTVPMVRQLDVA